VIVVGAGSTGATLAGRLSDDPSADVVVLEAGPAPRSAAVDEALRSPNPNRALQPGSPWVWDDLVARRTVAQEPYRYWRGRGLGGTSAVNGQLAIRPGPEDFDAWPDGWRWGDVLPAFVRLEDDLQFGGEPFHGTGGPIPVDRAPLDRWEPVDLALREAALALGHPECPDHNAPTGTGVSPFASNSRDRRRVSTADAYLEPARDRPNLRIRGGVLVDRVLLDGTGRAAGVVLAEGETVEADLVVLSAGAVHSPAILQRSGIGPAGLLRSLGIEVVADLPVGQTLMEHPIAFCVLRLRPEARASSHDARYTNITVRYSSGLADGGRNDLMLIANNLVGGEQGLEVGIVGVALERSRSTGWVRISSTDPAVDPELELRMLDHPDDLVRLRDGARRLFEVAAHPAVAATATRITAGRSTAIEDLAEDDALDGWLLAECIEGNHAASSCPMGPVLDDRCGVHGVAGLHVADASAFPTIPAANPHLTAVALGELLAERLRTGDGSAPLAARNHPENGGGGG